MAQLHNNKLDNFLEQQYDVVEEEFTLFPISSSMPAPEASITPEDTFSSSTNSDYDDVQREVGRVFGVLGHHISKLHNIKSAKKPANAKYKALKTAIKDLVAEAEKHGIKLDIQAATTPTLPDEEEIITDDLTEANDSLRDSMHNAAKKAAPLGQGYQIFATRSNYQKVVGVSIELPDIDTIMDSLEANWKHGARSARVIILDDMGTIVGQCVFDDLGQISPFQSEGYLKH